MRERGKDFSLPASRKLDEGRPRDMKAVGLFAPPPEMFVFCAALLS
jgi:hypothetical protein